jgi:hypothetical protein
VIGFEISHGDPLIINKKDCKFNHPFLSRP